MVHHEFGLIGIPFDKSIEVIGGRPGARFGPGAVRKWLENFPQDILKRITDFGDIDITDNILETHKRIESALREVFKTNIIPIIIGGDHSITYPSVKALCNAANSVGLIYFDAHYDMRPLKDGMISSGTSIRRLLDDGLIKGEKIVAVGIQKPKTKEGLRRSMYFVLKDYAEKMNVNVFTMSDVKKMGIETISKIAVKRATKGAEALYLSIDMDCVSERYAPGVSAPGPERLNPEELKKAVRMMANHVRAMDIAEISPPLDHDNITAKIGADLIKHFLRHRKNI
jgi:formiminoglutamase